MCTKGATHVSLPLLYASQMQLHTVTFLRCRTFAPAVHTVGVRENAQQVNSRGSKKIHKKSGCASKKSETVWWCGCSSFQVHLHMQLFSNSLLVHWMRSTAGDWGHTFAPLHLYTFTPLHLYTFGVSGV